MAHNPRSAVGDTSTCSLISDVLNEPIVGELGYFFECAWLFEQMGCAGHNLDLAFALHLRARLLVQIDHNVIFATNDQQRRCFYYSQIIASEIRTTAASYHR